MNILMVFTDWKLPYKIPIWKQMPGQDGIHGRDRLHDGVTHAKGKTCIECVLASILSVASGSLDPDLIGQEQTPLHIAVAADLDYFVPLDEVEKS